MINYLYYPIIEKDGGVHQFTKHKPEIMLNNFNTRLGLQIGRSFAALFPHDPQYEGRHVITFHNQRDFVFFRHHRYIFRNEKKVGLLELGPKFTLKLRSLQKGTFNSKFGEYEWVHKVSDFFLVCSKISVQSSSPVYSLVFNLSRCFNTKAFLFGEGRNI